MPTWITLKTKNNNGLPLNYESIALVEEAIRTCGKINKSYYIDSKVKWVLKLICNKIELALWSLNNDKDRDPYVARTIYGDILDHSVLFEEFGYYKSKRDDWNKSRSNWKKAIAVNPQLGDTFELTTCYEY